MLKRIWHGLALALTLAAIVTGLLYFSWIRAQARALTVLATTGNVPVLAWLVKAVTDDPRVSEIVVAGEPTTLARPGHGSRWAAIVFLNGATNRGRLHPDVQRLARGLARVGYLVLVPELPGLRRYEFTEQTLRTAAAVALAAARRPDVKGGRVTLVGVSTGTTLALLLAEDPRLAGRVALVAGIAPFTDLKRVIELATTGYYPQDGRLVRYEAKDFLGLVVGRSVVAALPSPRDRRLLEDLLGLDEHAKDPLGALRGRSYPDLSQAGRAAVALLANRDPRRFEALFAGLPGPMRAALGRLSPVMRVAALDTPVELATAPHDKYFPVEESRAIERKAPHVRVTVTSTLHHAIPRLSLSEIGDLFRFDAFAVRVLRAASR